MCPVHFNRGCSCRWARGGDVVIAFAVAFVFAGCAVLSGITPADRAAGYAAEAKAIGVLCKAYRFDRATGLVPEVPAMAELCR